MQTNTTARRRCAASRCSAPVAWSQRRLTPPPVHAPGLPSLRQPNRCHWYRACTSQDYAAPPWGGPTRSRPMICRAQMQELPTESLWVAAPGESRRRGASCVAYKGAIYQFGGVDVEACAPIAPPGLIQQTTPCHFPFWSNSTTPTSPASPTRCASSLRPCLSRPRACFLARQIISDWHAQAPVKRHSPPHEQVSPDPVQSPALSPVQSPPHEQVSPDPPNGLPGPNGHFFRRMPAAQGTVYNTVHKWSLADGWVQIDTRGVPPAPRFDPGTSIPG